MYNCIKLPNFALKVRFLFPDFFRIQNVYFGSGSDPVKSFGSFRIRICNTGESVPRMRRLVPLLERGDNAGEVLKELGQQLVKVRVLDPDWIRIKSGQWIRIRNRIRNPDPDRGDQKWPTKVEKKKFHVLKCWMYSFES
jgi:hypothetical protein